MTCGPVHAEDFVKKPDGLGKGGRVLFVAPDDPPLGTPATRHVFGKLQVVDYAGPAAAVCASLHDDFTRVADGAIDPGLGDDYGLLALLDKGQPAARDWQLLTQLCRIQNRPFPRDARANACPCRPARILAPGRTRNRKPEN